MRHQQKRFMAYLAYPAYMDYPGLHLASWLSANTIFGLPCLHGVYPTSHSAQAFSRLGSVHYPI